MFEPLTEFLAAHEVLVLSLLTASFLAFTLTLLAVPWLVVRIPHDYFAGRERAPAVQHSNRFLHYGLAFLKNFFGLVFIVIGLSMLVLPGQGLLTILIGVMLLDFPGKYAFECWLVRRRPILHSINWLRARFGHRPLEF